MTGTVDTARLRRVQTGARATLGLGIGASLAANMLAAHPSLIGRLVAGWSPLALMLTVELLSRVPTSSGHLSRLRVVAAGAIAAIAAWVSYWHMAEVSLSVGESAIAAHLLPLSVDGLVVVASICLVEISNHLNPNRTRTARPTADTSTRRPTSQPTAAASPSVATMPSRPSQRLASAERVRQLAAEHPDWTQAQLAESAGCSIRTVRRHLSGTPTTEPPSEPSLPDVDPATPENHQHDTRPREEVAA